MKLASTREKGKVFHVGGFSKMAMTTVKRIPEQIVHCKEYTMRTFADYFKEMPHSAR